MSVVRLGKLGQGEIGVGSVGKGSGPRGISFLKLENFSRFLKFPKIPVF